MKILVNYKIMKRSIDLLLSVLSLIILFPILLVIGIIIKIDSKGPIFYLAKRTGLLGEEFLIIKFRTMVVDADKIGGGTTALNDSRITGIGKFLRKYKIDEIPQLINVFKGEMSLVGPRPELPYYTKQYDNVEKLALTVRPGITDYSSIEHRSLDELVGADDADRVYEEKIFKKKNLLRVKYVREQNFLVDLKIILNTIFVILKK